MFHWCSDEDRKRQLCHYMKETFKVPESETALAIEAGQRAQNLFRKDLQDQGTRVLEEVTKQVRQALVKIHSRVQDKARELSL